MSVLIGIHTRSYLAHPILKPSNNLINYTDFMTSNSSVIIKADFETHRLCRNILD